MQRVLVRCGLNEIHQGKETGVGTRIPRGGPQLRQAEAVRYLILVNISFLSVAGTFLRTEQEDGLFHPRLVRYRHLIGKRAGDRSVVTDYDRRDGRSTRLAVTFARGQCLCTLIHFLFLRTVDEDGGEFLFGFVAFKHGSHGQGFVRRHLQVLKVYGKFHGQVSVSQ